MFQKNLEVQEGIWIDKQWIRDAGLGSHLQITVKSGEIRIVPAQLDDEKISSSKGWAIFRTLGNDAQPGQLENAAGDHDHYLYGKGE